MIERRGSEHALTPIDLQPFLTERRAPEEQIHALMDLALREGGNDNVACIILQI
jgi:serine/threonine protein phosphatase PrpC